MPHGIRQDPTLGRIVRYRLDEVAAQRINEQEANHAEAGEERAAVITKVWGMRCVNLRVFADGRPEADIWCTSVPGPNPEQNGCWFWPEEV